MIATAATAVLPMGSRVSLFGSRTDDTRRGGDIDLLVEPAVPLGATEQVGLRTRLAARLCHLMGERRIDILVCNATGVGDRLKVAEARRHAVELGRTGTTQYNGRAWRSPSGNVPDTAPR